MGLIDYIEKTRSEPEGVKQRTAIIITIIITMIIAGIWLTVSSISRSELDNQKDSIVKPFTALKDIFKF